METHPNTAGPSLPISDSRLHGAPEPQNYSPACKKVVAPAIAEMLRRPVASLPLLAVRRVSSSIASKPDSDAAPTRPLNPYSSVLTSPRRQGASQAMLYAAGLSRTDMGRPQIGIGSVWWEGNPCNSHLLGLSERVKAGVNAAGLVGLRFNTIGVSDGISMGTRGMSYSLPSRESECKRYRCEVPVCAVHPRHRSLQSLPTLSRLCWVRSGTTALSLFLAATRTCLVSSWEVGCGQVMTR